MKKILFTIAIFVIASLHSVLFAQSEVRASVCVGDERLDNLLTEEQKNSVTHLTVTGTLQDEDYACLRTMLGKSLTELDLHDADIDTIPAHALESRIWYRDITIILPAKLKYLSDYSLCLRDGTFTIVFTGDYPAMGNNVYHCESHENRYNCEFKYVASDDNPNLKGKDGFLYSSDGTKLYVGSNSRAFENQEIEYGTKIINEKAFESKPILYSILVIPETLDSIGDRAFADWSIAEMTTCGHYSWGYLTCLAVNPPKLGKDVFACSETQYGPYIFEEYGLVLYVPDGSEELYRAAEGWKNFWKIYPISEFHGGESGVKSIGNDERVAVREREGYFVMEASRRISGVAGYEIGGRKIYSNTVGADAVKIPKASLAHPYTLLRISYEDGTKEMVKLNP